MNQYHGLTAEMYQSVKALVDDRVKEILSYQDHDRLAEGQERLGGRMDRVEAALERLAEAQARTEERIARLAEVQEHILERLDRLEATVERLAEAQARTEEKLGDLIEVVSGMKDTQGALRGSVLELAYRRRVGDYFGPLLRRVHIVSPIEIEDDLEAHLSTEEFRDLLLVDLVVSGYPRHFPDASQVWLAVEISGVVDRHDVERARQRAGYLNKAGYRALPVVAGEDVTKGAEAIARENGVVMVLDGWADGWEQALRQLLEKV